MPRLALLVEYLGTNFSGSQLQVGVRTVQGELEKALAQILRRPTRVHLSGRTDSGVHAVGQVCHIDVEESELDLWRLNWGLNGILPTDLAIRQMEYVADNFHSRHTAISRQYRYQMLNRPQRAPLSQATSCFLPVPLDADAMADAALCLVGSHDFASFCSTSRDKVTTRVNVTRAELLNLGEGRLEFWIEANHFVYNMVRIIVGTLIEIGLGERAPESLEKALQGCDRNLCGPTAPASGLTLVSVSYPEQFQLFQKPAPVKDASK